MASAVVNAAMSCSGAKQEYDLDGRVLKVRYITELTIDSLKAVYDYSEDEDEDAAKAFDISPSTSVKSELRDDEKVAAPTERATAIRAAIKPYSMAVAPDSSARK